MPIPNPTRLFHITAIANLPAIIASGALVSKNAGASQGIGYQNIAHRGAQGARAAKRVPDPPGGIVHDYVPFYFAPRSPMLMAIHGGKVAAGQCVPDLSYWTFEGSIMLLLMLLAACLKNHLP